MREEAGTAHAAASVSDHSQVTAQASHSTKVSIYLSRCWNCKEKHIQPQQTQAIDHLMYMFQSKHVCTHSTLLAKAVLTAL